jgi:hypothetical protein
MREGQEREIYSNLVGDRQELHSSSLVSQIRSKGRGQKSGLEGVGEGDLKNKGPFILFLGQSTHRQKADILSFPSRGRPPPTFHPITVFLSLGATKKSGTAGYCGTAYAVPGQGNHLLLSESLTLAVLPYPDRFNLFYDKWLERGLGAGMREAKAGVGCDWNATACNFCVQFVG